MTRKSEWLRLYTAILDCRKIQALPDRLFRALVNLWCVAKEHDGLLPPAVDIAWRLRMKEDKVASWVADLHRAQLLDETSPGHYEPHDWKEHQYASDSSAERTRRWRQCHSDNDVTPGVTPGDQSGDGAVTPRARAQNRTENKVEERRAEHRHSDARCDVAKNATRFSEWWKAYPHKVNEDAAARTWISLDCDSQAPQIMACLERFQQSQLWADGKYQNPENWLRANHATNWSAVPAARKRTKREAMWDQV